jgi:xylulokinase
MRLTGGAPGFAGKDPLCHILWIRRQKPDIYQQAYKFLEPKDYVNLCFTGKFAATYDSILLHWVTDNRDPSHVVYSDQLLKMTGIDRAKLPDLIRATDILGAVKNDIAAELGLPKGTPVIASTPDVPCTSIGSGAVRDYEGYLYVGTSSWISAHVPFKKADVVHNFGSFPSPVTGRYIILSEQQGAGNCLAWLRDNILYHKDELIKEERVPDIYKVMDKIVERVPAGARNLIFTPWLYGERTPADDSHIRASLFNISLANNREDILRAVFEGVAFNSRWLLEPVEKFIGRPFAHLNFIGGGANSDVWSQIFADVFNRKIRQVKDPLFANTRGAAFLAAIALKYITFDEVSRFVPIKDEYLPDPANRVIYEKLYKEFLKLYKAQKKACARMNSK